MKMDMDGVKQKLFYEALNKYGHISPCNDLDFRDCFTIEDDRVYFWFNVDNTTKIEGTKIE
jgi:hypothetical protein